MTVHLYDHFLASAEIPTNPGVTQRLHGVLNGPSPSVAEATKVIGLDPSAAARILRIANSPYYGFQQSISSIRDAVCLIGLETLTTALAGQASTASSNRLDSLTLHAQAVAQAARIVACRVYYPNRDKAYTAGLLHDFGKFVISAKSSPEQAKIDRFVRTYGVPTMQAEALVLGVDHAAIGGRVLEHWDLPLSLVDAVRFHDHPTHSTDAIDLCGIVSLANVIAHRAGIGGPKEIYEIDPVVLEYFGLSRASMDVLQKQLVDEWQRAEPFTCVSV